MALYIYQHCTDEAQKAETVLSAVSYIYIYILLDNLVCSIVGYFYDSRGTLASP